MRGNFLTMIVTKYAHTYCCEDISKIENYEKAVNDSTQTWEIHHKREISENKSKKQLITENLYYKRPAEELVFMTKFEHRKLHKRGNTFRRGKHHSDAAKQKIREANLGKNNPNYGKPRSTTTKQKISEAERGKQLSAATKQKISQAAREAMRGMVFWNNGIINKRAKECPGLEWKKGRLS